MIVAIEYRTGQLDYLGQAETWVSGDSPAGVAVTTAGWLEYSVTGRCQYAVEGRAHYTVPQEDRR